MATGDLSKSSEWRAGLRALGSVLATAFVGPIVGVALAVAGVVFAPPWLFLTGLLYVALTGLALPIGVTARAKGWLGPRGLAGSLVLAAIVALFYLTLIGPWLPGGETTCQPSPANGPAVRYRCVATSSDDPSYRREFTVQARPGWPLARIVSTDFGD